MNQKRKIDLMTPSVFLLYHPTIRRVWDARKIGYLFYLKLVEGKKLARGCLISEAGVLAIYEQYFGIIEN